MSTISGKMSTFSGKRLSTFSGKCQPFQEIKPTPTPIPEQGSPTRSLSQRGRETQSLSGFKGNSFNFFQGLYAHGAWSNGQGHFVIFDFGLVILLTIIINIYIYIIVATLTVKN